MVKSSIIHAKNLTKVYKLYAKPVYRCLDVIGLLPRFGNRYTTHHALANINLTINQGEKVAIIGRNGAGKSTFLKLVTGVLRPTLGTIEVLGKTAALLQIGTGFHPDFSGRQNVLAYLACLGFGGKDAADKVKDVISFAEIEEYIDQPLKSYSTGMAARLMFAAATVLSPEILVLDEILGVGDAYFANKSYERIRHLCDANGTTVLLVSHDVYSAAAICNRMIWLDQGKVMMDGDSTAVLHAYEDSIRQQEENRLREKRLTAVRNNLGDKELADSLLFGQIHCVNRRAVERPIFFSHLRFYAGSKLLDSLDLGCADKSDFAQLVAADGEGNWGRVERHSGRLARPFAPHGSIFHRLPFCIGNQDALGALIKEDLQVEVEVFGIDHAPLELVLFAPDGKVRYKASLEIRPTESWHAIRVVPRHVSGPTFNCPVPSGIARYGSRAFEITDVAFLNSDGNETYHFQCGQPFKIRLGFQINVPGFSESPTIVVGFLKQGVLRTHRFWADKIHFSYATQKQGTLEIEASPLLLTQGNYLVNISVFKEGYYESTKPKKFFSACDELYDCHVRAYEFVVEGKQQSPLLQDVVFQHPCTWRLGEKTGTLDSITSKDEHFDNRVGIILCKDAA